MNRKLLFLLALNLTIIFIFVGCSKIVPTETPIPGDYEFDVQIGIHEVIDKGNFYEIIFKFYCYTPELEGDGAFDDVLSLEVRSGDETCEAISMVNQDILFSEESLVEVWAKYKINKDADLYVAVTEKATGKLLEELPMDAENLRGFVGKTPVPQKTPEGL